MSDYYRDTVKILKQNGCYFVRNGKGDHEIWYSPITMRAVTVPRNLANQITANAVLKQAGIRDFKF